MSEREGSQREREMTDEAAYAERIRVALDTKAADAVVEAVRG